MVTEELRYPVMLPHEFLAVVCLQHRSEFDAFILGPGAHSCRHYPIRGAPSQAHRTEGPAGAPEAARRWSADWQGQEEIVRLHFVLFDGG